MAGAALAGMVLCRLAGGGGRRAVKILDCRAPLALRQLICLASQLICLA